jgi:hypothetical protein
MSTGVLDAIGPQEQPNLATSCWNEFGKLIYWHRSANDGGPGGFGSLEGDFGCVHLLQASDSG